MDGDVFPNTIDYWGPSGMVFLRNPQVRWTPSNDGELARRHRDRGAGLGARPGQGRPRDPRARALQAWNSYPDLTGQVRYGGDWGHVQLAAILRGLGVEGTTPPDASSERPRDRARSSAGASTRQRVRDEHAQPALEGDQILVQVAYGQGIANYMNDGGTDLAPDDDPPGPTRRRFRASAGCSTTTAPGTSAGPRSIGYSEHRQYPLDGQTRRRLQGRPATRR